MSPRTGRILRVVLVSLLGLAVVVVIAGIWIAQTQWFRGFVRDRIVQSVEESTGGRVEISQFLFDWHHLRAEVRGFVLHGKEPAGAQPLFSTRNLVVELRFAALVERRRLEISLLDIDQPQANVIVFPDGTTNVPEPKVQHKSDKSALDTIVDLSIGRFNLQNGSVQFADRKVPFTASGENLHAVLSYEPVVQRYSGEIDLNPLYLQSGQNQRTNVNVKLPVVLGRDRIQLADAVLATPASRLQISATMDHLVSPHIAGRAAGQIDLPEVKRAVGASLPVSTAANVPHVLYADVQFASDDKGTRLSDAKLLLGKSSLQASGNFQNTALDRGSLRFTSDLDLQELGRLMELALQTGGSIGINGNAILNGASDYAVDASVNGRNLSFRSGGMRVSNASLSSRITADPHTVRANPVRLNVAGGEMNASATLENRSAYQVKGTLSHFDLGALAALAMSKPPGYGGVISGPFQAQGDLNAKHSLQASANLGITPTARGVPVRGQLNARYDSRGDTVILNPSYIALPASRLDLSGSLGQQITLTLKSRNLADFQPVMALASSSPPARIPLQIDAGGLAEVDASISGKLSSPTVGAHLSITKFEAEQRRFDSLTADLNAASNNVSIRNAALTRGDLNAQFQASLGLNQWKPQNASPLSASLGIHNADVQDLLALAGETSVPVRGALTLTAQAGGTMGDPQGTADLGIVNGAAYGEPLDRLNTRVMFGGQWVTLSSLHVESGMARVDANGTFQHPLNSFATGNLHAHVNTSQVALSRLKTLQQKRPDLDGSVQLNLDADARLQPAGSTPPVQLLSVNGSAAARGLRMNGNNLGDVSADVQTSGDRLTYRLVSDFAGSSIRADGRTQLIAGYPTSATLNIQDLPVEQALAVAGKSDLGAKGIFSASGQVEGTTADPRANLDISLTKAILSQQPIDRLQAHVNYSGVLVDIPNLNVQAGPNRVNMSASFRHPMNDFSTGDLRLRTESNTLQLAQMKYLQDQKPGLTGTLELMADAAATLNQPGASPRISFRTLNARVAASGIHAGGRDFGGLTATAEQSGQAVRFNLDSNLAQASIKGSGDVQLNKDYPVKAQVTLANVRYDNLRGLIGAGAAGPAPDFDALLEGSLDVAGPLTQPGSLTGTAQFTRMEVTTKAPTAKAAVKGAKSGPTPAILALRNDGPVTIVANPSGIEVQRAHWTGPSTDINVSGNVVLRPAVALNLNVAANADLAILKQIDRDISSEGNIVLNGSAKGPAGDPTLNGRLELKNAAFQTTTMPNGISKANGVVVLSGNSARIESFTAESGGGRVTAGGSVVRSNGTFVFNLNSRATNVMVRTESGASVSANANVKLTGTTMNSLLSGNATIRSVGFTPRTDLGAILTTAGQPMETPGAPTGLMSGMKLDVDVRMAPGVTFRSPYAENLEAQADLNLRGTLENPGLLGRVSITQGELVFFGTKYTVNEGSVSFFNPNKIDPILNMNLETTARGVDVTLTVTGPVSNMNLSYQSDPPLQFSEIVGLLAVGRMPTSDPVLVAHQPATPQQSMQQMGESALLSAAVANPISNQLERVFGVTQLKIDPTFTSGSELPQARLTLQQQVASNLTFTYVTDVSRTDPQIIRVEWAINPQWSAVASREQNGMVGVDLFYKRKFR